ncbi:uncharacterized protein FA14DRAFT_174002 [Meira miltonrushii]|uniref:F-box domain-containing protein n=1 Tax=Meira miltonrushii TaxID=1280837 RepID=A0A316V9Y5_9BASI|nr:uncharacterized protein FA14DRAFT_174002 [Meira miltonrushii]PWN34306.1 hypothetical protein FA14DRAFT_174002 [Meira miltonrushii]
MSNHSPIVFREREQINQTNQASTSNTNTQHDFASTTDDPSEWPSLNPTQPTSHIDQSGAAISTDADLREDLGPRTLHRKAKPKPGIPFKVLKARAAAEAENEDGEGDPLAQIAVLPPELLARIFAHLDARSMVQCAFVCRAFNFVIRDEATWRLAFSLAFGIEAVEADQATTPILRRVEPSSWKQEYMQRTDLIRRWRKARAPTVISDARVGVIHSIALSLPHNFMLSASLAHGVASRCDPFTGKVSKGFLDASGQVHAAGLAALAAEQGVLDISAVCLEADATRIVWGFHSGAVAMTNLARQGTNPRGLIRGVQFSTRSSHIGPIMDIAMPFGTGAGGAHSIERSPEKIRQRQAALGDASETFVTAGMDGSVKLWSPKKAVPLWTDVAHQNKQASGPASRPVPVMRLAIHLESGTIVAATSSGHLTMWTNIDIAGLLNLPASAFEEPNTLEPTLAQKEGRKAMEKIHARINRFELQTILSSATEPVIVPTLLALDIDLSGSVHDRKYEKAQLLCFSEDASTFARYTVNLNDANVIVKRDVFIAPKASQICCLRPDFELTKAVQRSSATTAGVVTVPGQDTALSTDQYGGPALFSERKYVCGGTKDGKLIIWDWEAESKEGEDIQAWSCLDAHHMGITALDVTEHAIVVGSSDGTIKAFCPLSGQLIRMFNDRSATRHPARMLASGQLTEEEASRFHVGQIIAGKETIVACIGSQVLAWRAERLRNNKTNAGKKVTSRTGRNAMGRLWDPKMQSQKEMERDIYETKQELQQEQEDRLADRQRLGTRPESELDDMTEQEAFEYAMMLSRDEMDEKSKGGSATGSKGVGLRKTSAEDELQDALEQIALAESSADSSKLVSQSATDDEDGEDALDESQDDMNHTYRSTSRSSATSPNSSPFIHAFSSPPSRAWDILQNAGSSASRNMRVGDANSKVQAVHVPRNARLPSYSTASSSRRPSNSNLSKPSFDSPQDWPVFEPSNSFGGKSPSRLDLGSPVPHPTHASFGNGNRKNSFNASTPASTVSATQSPSSSFQARSPIGAWAQGSPSLRPIHSSKSSSSPSALTASRPSMKARSGSILARNENENQTRSSSPSNDNQMDDDLRFAIELSLAEERSRQEESRKRKGKQPQVQ